MKHILSILLAFLPLVAFAQKTTLPVARPTSQAANRLSTNPKHLTLCAVAPSGQIVYITTAQWKRFSESVRSSYKPKGVCLSQGIETFLVELHDKDGGRESNWNAALKYNLPTKVQGEIIIDNKNALNNALRAFGGTAMDKWYWTKTRVASSGAWYIGMDFESVNYSGKVNTHRVRSVSPVLKTALSSASQNTPQTAETFSTTPVHLALCATGPDGQIVYITTGQLQALSVPARSAYNPKGVCISQGGKAFLVDLYDKDDGNQMDWNAARKYNLPSKAQGEIIRKNKDVINETLRAFGVEEFAPDWYWTRTESDNSSAWNIGMDTLFGSSYSDKTNECRVRAIISAPSSSAI